MCLVVLQIEQNLNIFLSNYHIANLEFGKEIIQLVLVSCLN
jgi:hypothetical protein